jgi:AcrR family transcriptional regulator
MDQVAADAVVSKPTVYSHFEDKSSSSERSCSV